MGHDGGGEDRVRQDRTRWGRMGDNEGPWGRGVKAATWLYDCSCNSGDKQVESTDEETSQCHRSFTSVNFITVLHMFESCAIVTKEIGVNTSQHWTDVWGEKRNNEGEMNVYCQDSSCCSLTCTHAHMHTYRNPQAVAALILMGEYDVTTWEETQENNLPDAVSSVNSVSDHTDTMFLCVFVLFQWQR